MTVYRAHSGRQASRDRPIAGRHIHCLQNDVHALKAQLGTTAESNLVVVEIDRLRADTGAEVLKLKVEIDTAGTERSSPR